MINWRRRARFSCLLGLLFATSAQAQWEVPADASVQLNGGTIGLGGSDLRVAGSLSLGSGIIDAAHAVAIAATGVIDAGSGSLKASGDWSNAGSFISGISQVIFFDGSGSVSNFSGDTHFHDASFISATGKSYSFAAGSAQEYDGLLRILGTAALAIQVKSSAAGQVAYFNLLPSGSQDIHFVGVSDVYAIGQPLAPSESNQGGTGNDAGWFGNTTLADALPIPTLSTLGAFLLALALAALAARRRQEFLD